MTVLAAYSKSAEGRAALRHGRRIAGAEGEGLVVFDLDATSRSADREIDPTVPDEGGGPATRWYARDSEARNAAGELVDLAEQLAVRLVVVGVRRRSPIGKLVLGSNAQQIIIDSHVPVLAVKAEAGDER